MTTDKSTPRPWRAAEPYKGHCHILSVSRGRCGTICNVLDHLGYSDGEFAANAALIVRAVNRSDAVDALVEAARETVALLMFLAPEVGGYSPDGALAHLRAALAAYDKEPDA